MSNSFPRTKAALEGFDASAADRDLLWNNSTTDLHVMAAEKIDAAALTMVQAAFYLDTTGINSLVNCLRVPLDYLRKCVANDSLPSKVPE